MPQPATSANDNSFLPTHPLCAECKVPMWLVAVEQVDRFQRERFQCQACDAEIIVDVG